MMLLNISKSLFQLTMRQQIQLKKILNKNMYFIQCLWTLMMWKLSMISLRNSKMNSQPAVLPFKTSARSNIY